MTSRLEFFSHTPQYYIHQLTPELSSMDIEPSLIELEDPFIPSLGALVKENTLKFLAQSDVTVPSLLAQLTTPGQLLYSLETFNRLIKNEIHLHLIEKGCAYLTTIETQFLDQLDNLIRTESKKTSYNRESFFRTLSHCICDFRSLFMDAVSKITRAYDSSSMNLKYSCLHYIPSLQTNKSKEVSHLPKLSMIATLRRLVAKEGVSILDVEFTLKQSVLGVEKELYDQMEISQRAHNSISWAPYIEIWNTEGKIESRSIFNFTILDLVHSDILKKINKLINPNIFSVNLRTFFELLSGIVERDFKDCTVTFMGDLLDVLCKYKRTHNCNNGYPEIFSTVSKFILAHCSRVIRFSCQPEVESIQHTFDSNNGLEIRIPSFFCSDLDSTVFFYNWMNFLCDAISIELEGSLPLELLFPPSLSGRKRKRQDIHSSFSSPYYQINRFPPLFLKHITKLSLIGEPTRPFHLEEWNQIMAWIGPGTNLSLPVSCLYSPDSSFTWLQLDSCLSLNRLNIIVSGKDLSLLEAERKKQISYLNQYKERNDVMVILDFEKKEVPSETLEDYAEGLMCPLSLKFNKSYLAQDFNVTWFLQQIEKGQLDNILKFVKMICHLNPLPFSIEQIDLIAKLNQEGNCLIRARLAEDINDIVESGEGDLLFNYPSMRHPALIRDLLDKLSRSKKDSTHLNKKITAVLLELTLTAQNIPTSDIPDYRSKCDALEYLLKCITKYPAVMDHYPEHIIEITQQNTMRCPKHSLTGTITLQLLQNLKAREEIDRLLLTYEEYFSDSNEEPNSDITFDDCVHFLCLFNQNEVMRNLVLYPKTLNLIVLLFRAAFWEKEILVRTHFLKQLEGIVSFIIKKDYLNKSQLELLFVGESFNIFFFHIIRSLKATEQELFVKRLMCVAEMFCAEIFSLYSKNDPSGVSYKNDVTLLLTLFLKQGWNPFPKIIFKENNDFRYLLIPFLQPSLPHLDAHKQEWIPLIAQGLRSIKPILSLNDQQSVSELLEFFLIKKQRTIKEWDPEVLRNYPTISKFFLTMCINQQEQMIFGIGEKAYFNTCNRLFIELLEQQHISEEEAIQFAYLYMYKLKEEKEDSSILRMIGSMFTTLCNYPAIQEKLLKKSCVFSENPYKRSLLPTSKYLARTMIYMPIVLSERSVSLCARILIDRDTTFDTLDPIPCVNNSFRFTKAVTAFLKESDECTLKNRPKLLLFLWDIYRTDYNAYKSAPNGEVYRTLLDKGEVLLTALLEQPNDLIVDQIVLLEKEEFEKSHNLIRDIMSLLLISNKFMKRKNDYGIPTLKLILRHLPTLSGDAQKASFRLIKNGLISYWFNRQPVYCGKYIKYLSKQILTGEIRQGALSLFYMPCSQENFQALSVLVSKLEPLSSTELYWMCRAQGTNSVHCLGRELRPQEKWIFELSNYQVELRNIQKVRRFIEKPYVSPIDLNESMEDTVLGVFDLINFTDSKNCNYVNPSFLLLDKKPIDPPQFREYIQRLMVNAKRRMKISGVPENDEERELFYSFLNQYLAHIAHILAQQDPLRSTAYFFALGEIGSKCGVQYLEIPGLYHTLVQQAEFPLIPHWISIKTLSERSGYHINYPFENIIKYGFLSRVDLLKRLNTILGGNVNDHFPFKHPINDKEIAYFYDCFNKKISLILYLLQTLPINLRENILAHLARLELNSAQEVLKEVEKVARILSLAWLIPYLNKYALCTEAAEELIGPLIQGELNGGKETDVSANLKKILLMLYSMNGEQTKETLHILSNAFKQEPEKMLDRLNHILRDGGGIQGINQPLTLQDNLEMVLHDRRWKYLRDKLSEHSDAFSVNVHNRKYIEHELSELMGIYHAYSCLSRYEDKYVAPETKKVIEQLKKDFKREYNVIFLLNIIKSEISKSIPFGDVISWFKKNHPQQMAWEEFRANLYDVDFQFQDRWLVYMLEKMEFISKDNQ